MATAAAAAAAAETRDGSGPPRLVSPALPGPCVGLPCSVLLLSAPPLYGRFLASVNCQSRACSTALVAEGLPIGARRTAACMAYQQHLRRRAVHAKLVSLR